MAEIIALKGKRSAMPHIDLTPMVDLGFLLITFFMMTTTMAKPAAMEIQMPYQPPDTKPTIWYASSSITLMPAKDHKIYYYEGVYAPGLKLKQAGSLPGLRNILQHKQKALLQRDNPRERDLQVLIKAHTTATADDIVGLFDEMNILGVKYFAMVDMYPEEAAMVLAGSR